MAIYQYRLRHTGLEQHEKQIHSGQVKHGMEGIESEPLPSVVLEMEFGAQACEASTLPRGYVPTPGQSPLIRSAAAVVAQGVTLCDSRIMAQVSLRTTDLTSMRYVCYCIDAFQPRPGQ